MRRQVCTLLLDNLPPFDPALFSVFGSLTTIRGLLSVTNNQNLYALAFLTNVTLVVLLCWLMSSADCCSQLDQVVIASNPSLIDARIPQLLTSQTATIAVNPSKALVASVIGNPFAS